MDGQKPSADPYLGDHQGSINRGKSISSHYTLQCKHRDISIS